MSLYIRDPKVNELADFMSSIDAIEAEIPVGTHDAALDTARTFGRFICHPVRLNFGDCFSYASVTPLDASLLFVGKDFPQKDTAAA